MDGISERVFELESSGGSSRIEVRIARNFDDMMMAFCIRSAVFLAEQSCPYREEFDGNDATATHVIGFVDEEPAATMRIRYFGSFAKMERVAVRREFRMGRVATKLLDYSVRFLRRKGYQLINGQAQEGRERYWLFVGSRFGDAYPIPGAPQFSFSGHVYSALCMEMPLEADTLKIDTDPMILNRPEGEWDHPGVLELSRGKLGTKSRARA